jgi:low temperature requirement protein LtrA
VTIATVATLVAVVGVTRATRDRADWRVWRRVAWVPVAASVLGLLSALDAGWAKIAYVLGITLPVTVVAWLVYRDADRELADDRAT